MLTGKRLSPALPAARATRDGLQIATVQHRGLQPATPGPRQLRGLLQRHVRRTSLRCQRPGPLSVSVRRLRHPLKFRSECPCNRAFWDRHAARPQGPPEELLSWRGHRACPEFHHRLDSLTLKYAGDVFYLGQTARRGPADNFRELPRVELLAESAGRRGVRPCSNQSVNARLDGRVVVLSALQRGIDNDGPDVGPTAADFVEASMPCESINARRLAASVSIVISEYLHVTMMPRGCRGGTVHCGAEAAKSAWGLTIDSNGAVD